MQTTIVSIITLLLGITGAMAYSNKNWLILVAAIITFVSVYGWHLWTI